MSAELSTVFYGVLFHVDREELEELETRTHRLLVAARRNGLDNYWINPGEAGLSINVLIGKKLGIVGAEHESMLQLDIDKLLVISQDVQVKLQKAELMGTPRLFFMWYPDND